MEKVCPKHGSEMRYMLFDDGYDWTCHECGMEQVAKLIGLDIPETDDGGEDLPGLPLS